MCLSPASLATLAVTDAGLLFGGGVRYRNLKDGEGVEFKSREVFKLACCDCGLVHDVVLVASPRGRKIGLALRRNKRATAARRRGGAQAAAGNGPVARLRLVFKGGARPRGGDRGRVG